MLYWVIKSNPTKYRVENGIRKLILREYTSWSVSARFRKGDVVFIGMSGPAASILVEAEIKSDPKHECGDPSEPEWIDKKEAKKLRWYAECSPLKRCLSTGIPEADLRKAGLGRIADFLHRQGISLVLKSGEESVLDSLF